MRRRFLALFASVAIVGPAVAQSTPVLAEVAVDSVAVRAGPSDTLPETGSLFRGARVVIDHDETEFWVAIQPPRGQVSWVKNLNLGPLDGQAGDLVPRNAIVHGEPDAELAYGRPGFAKPLNVRRTKVPDQTILLVIGKKIEHEGSWWLPVEPPEGDFRYLPKSAVRVVKGTGDKGFVVNSPKPDVLPAGAGVPKVTGFSPVPAALAGTPSTTPPKPRDADWPNHPLWIQAEQADRAQDYQRAEELYLKLAKEMIQPNGDAELANLCYTRIHAVREKQRTTRGTESARKSDPALEAAPKWLGPGILRVAGFKMDGKATFALVDKAGTLKCYAIAGPGVDLEKFRGNEVEVYGTLTYPGDLRGAGVVTATRVQTAR